MLQKWPSSSREKIIDIFAVSDDLDLKNPKLLKSANTYKLYSDSAEEVADSSFNR